MKLRLTRPLVFFDLEATGLDVVKDRIVELCYIKVFPNGNEESKTLRLNPQIPIPTEASRIHGIYDQDVADCPVFKQVANELAKMLEGCDLAGYNSNHFDIPLLAEEMLRADVSIDFSRIRRVDVQNIFHKLEQRTLVAAYKFYCRKELENAHSAFADTRATYEVLMAQLDHYPDVLQNDVSFLSDFSRMNNNVDLAGRMAYNDAGVEVFRFGKYKGESVRKTLEKDSGYYAWILDGDFPAETKQALTRIKLEEINRNVVKG